jgi:hypothetical protein
MRTERGGIRMLNASEANMRAREISKRSQERLEKLLNDSIERAIDQTEKNIEEAVERGAFSCDSPNLCGSEFTDGIALSIDEIEDTLREALISHFKPLGYTFDGLGCNYLKIIWRSEKE